MPKKTILITGAAKGIGFEACRRLGREGFRVFLSARDAARGEKAAAQLRSEGTDAAFLLLDVSDAAGIERAAGALERETDRLDALINNAGVFLDDSQSPLVIDPDIIRKTFEINTLGPLLVTRRLRALLGKAGAAQVVNISSKMGQLSEMQGGSIAYRISKTALNAVTRVLAAELAGDGIRVHAVHPGWVKTDMGGAGASLPVEAGADTAVWLASGGAGEATGQFWRERKVIAW